MIHYHILNELRKMKFPYTKRTKLEEVVKIAETRLFERDHLERQVKDLTEYYLLERKLHNVALNLLLEEIFSVKNQTQINEIDSNHITKQAKQIAEIFTRWGSDKSTNHNYEILYDLIKSYFHSSKLLEPRILEVGCGGNDPKVRHAMPVDYVPLSSLRALKEIFDSKNIFGADIDKSLEYNEDFSIFIVDQFDSKSFDVIKSTELKFDLIIDDGVHDLYANNVTFNNLFDLVNTNGFYLIEDVEKSLVPIWTKCFGIYGIGKVKILTKKSFSKTEECAILIHKI